MRVIETLETGLAAGGENGELRSAALLVFAVDLRSDSGPEPLKSLRDVWCNYKSQMPIMIDRALAPDSV